MTLIGFIVLLAVLAIVGIFALWIINSYLPAPMHNIAKIIVGLILLIVLLVKALPSVANFQIT